MPIDPPRMKDAASDPDRADMERLVQGEERALDRLMSRHSGRLYAYLFRLLQNVGDAEDLAQETFVRVFEHRHRFDPGREFGSWLYTIATNLVRDRYRWRSRHPEAPLPDPASGHPGEGWGEDGWDPGPVPGQGLVEEERSLAVRRAIAHLPTELREAVILAEFEERSHAEIGEILGCSAKAVEMRVYRARQALRQALAAWLSHPEGR